MRYAICYVSTAAKEFEEEEISKLLENWTKKNNAHDVRGVLLYSKGNFFQVMEGDKQYVLELFGHIERDPRHHNLIQVLGKDLSHGAFDGYESDIVTDNNKFNANQLQDYLDQVKGLDQQTQQTVKNILRVFIDTRE